MNRLPERFRDGGFDFRLITRRGPVALLAKSKASLAESYEVVILQHRPKDLVLGAVVPVRETLQHSELWGDAGWSYVDRKDAEAKLVALTQKANFTLWSMRTTA